MVDLSNEALDAAHEAFMAHGDAQSFLNHPTRKFICRACGAELADVSDLRRHMMARALYAADAYDEPAFPTGSVGS